MLKDILAISGKPGLYRFLSQGSNLTIVESLTDKTRIPVYAQDKMITLGNVSIFTKADDVPIGDVFASIREKENGAVVSLDLTKADPDALRAYLAEVLPDFDPERVYPTEIKKIYKWYNILITSGITDFSTKEEEEIPESGTNEEVETSKEEKETQKPTKSPAATPAASKRKESGLTAAKSSKPMRASSMPKNATPKKSVVGSKRGG